MLQLHQSRKIVLYLFLTTRTPRLKKAMAEKKDTDLTLASNKQLVTKNGKFIIASQRVVPANLTNTMGQLGGQSISPNEGVYNPHLVIGAYTSPYYATSFGLSSVPDWLSASKPVLQVQSHIGELLNFTLSA